MLFLSLSSLYSGIFLLINIVTQIIVGLFVVYKSKKLNVRLLTYVGLFIVFGTFGTLGFICDFFTILLTGVNNNNIYGWLGILSFMWIPMPYFFLSYIAVELLIPEKKWHFFYSVITIIITYELFLFLNPEGSLLFFYPINPGEDFIDMRLSGIPVILFYILGMFTLLLSGFGLLIKSTKLKGVIRKKYLFLSIGFLMVLIQPLFGSFLPELLQFSLGLFNLISVIFIYIGLKPKTQFKPKKKKVPSQKESELVSYILRKPNSAEIKEEIKSFRVEKPILVFASYATKDVDTFNIQEITEALSSSKEIEKVLYWQEHMDDNIFVYMDDNLGKCDVMILFCSENALNSIPVKKEWTAADALGKPIIPIFVDPAYIPPLLSSRLGLEYDFYDMERNIRDLRNLILKKVRGIAE